MPEVVLLRDFEDDVPKDLRVTFCESLPEEALCILCENVSARLYKDPQGHGYCSSCREMCKRDDMFDCATCKKKWHVRKLKQEPSLHDAIRKARVICPRSNPDEPVQIPFSALTAHLKDCSCNDGAAPRSQSSNSHSSGKQQETIDPSDPQGEKKGSKMAQCCYCKKAIPKKSVHRHMEDCLQNLQMSSQHGDSEPKQTKNGNTTTQCDSFDDMSGDFSDERELPSYEAEDDTADAATKFTHGHTLYFDGSKGNPGKAAFPTDPNELSDLLANALHQIRDLKEEIAELRQTAAKTKGDTDLLSVAVPTIQEDMRNVQIQCEQRISKSEKTVSSLEEYHKSLQKTVSLLHGETREHLQIVQEMVKNTTEKLSIDVYDLQQKSNWLLGAVQDLTRKTEKMEKDNSELLQNVFPRQDETKKSKKGSSPR